MIKLQHISILTLSAIVVVQHEFKIVVFFFFPIQSMVSASSKPQGVG